MGWFTGIKTAASLIFSGGGGGSDGQSNVMTAATGIGNWIDEQQFTDQEKHTASAALIPEFAKFMNNTVAENSQRSKTRREIALWVMRNWIVMLWVCIVARGFELLIGATEHEFSSFVYKIATIEGLIYFVLGIGAFFFGAHITRQIKGT